MADDKQGRDDQADKAEQRQRERDLATELERRNEPEPPAEVSLGGLESELADFEFPATGADVVATVGDRTVDSPDGRHEVRELVADSEADRFESTADLARRIQQPTVAGAMKRVLEAAEGIRNKQLGTSQREAYEKTFTALIEIDADDNDESVRVIADWVVEQIHDDGKLPGSRAVRRQAMKHCRANGYEIREDDWLGI